MLFTANFITYKGLYRTVEIDRLTLPTIDGRRTVVSNHMPIMLALKIGVIETSNGKQLEHYAISDGMMMFKNNEATILCDSIVDVNEIDVDRAQRSVQKAESKMSNATSENEVLRQKIALARAMNLIASAKKFSDHN